MNVFDAVRTVLAVRRYQDRQLPDELVHRIVQAAWLTGSSRNGQPWHFIAVQNRETLRQLGSLARTGPYTAEAAAVNSTVLANTSPRTQAMITKSNCCQRLSRIGGSWFRRPVYRRS